MPLSSLPKAYGLSEIEKGIFPHLFNTPQNQIYSGPLPALDVYSLDSMDSKERRCKQDVTILRLACLAFQKNFIKYSVDPFTEWTTIAATCMCVFRNKFKKKSNRYLTTCWVQMD